RGAGPAGLWLAVDRGGSGPRSERRGQPDLRARGRHLCDRDGAAVSLRILLVEDEMLIAMMAEDMLGGLGHQVAGVHSGVASALEAVEAGGFDLALLDVNLGRESSEAVAGALAARNIPFVFVTGYGEAGIPSA